jgi:predicted dehydrogenase
LTLTARNTAEEKMSEQKMINVALVGAGRIADSAHLPAWKEQAEARVTLVAENRPKQAEAIAQKWGIPEWATNYKTILERHDIHAVDLCLPPHLHAPVTEEFLAQGKHVLVEKPMATTLDDARRMVKAAAQSRSVLMVAENWPFASSTRRVMDLMRAGALGEVFMLKAHHESGLYIDRTGETRPWVLNAWQAGGGYLFDAGIHTINLARHLMGEFASLFAYAAPGPPPEMLEDDVALAARFRSGAIGSMSFTGRSRHLGERKLGFMLFGDRGVAEFDIWSGRVSWTTNGVRTDTNEAGFSRGFHEEIRHFLDCIASGAKPLTSAEQQLGTLAAVLAIYQSLRDRRPVDPAELFS